MEEFGRLRLGTGNDELRGRMGDMDFVLSKFTPEEKEKLPDILEQVVEKIDEKNGGAYRNWTGVRGFADRCVTTPPKHHLIQL